MGRISMHTRERTKFTRYGDHDEMLGGAERNKESQELSIAGKLEQKQISLKTIKIIRELFNDDIRHFSK